VYTAFAIDVFSRKIVGWTCSMSKETDLVLDVIDRGCGTATTGRGRVTISSFTIPTPEVNTNAT
jgi:transposase InsO family protein